MQNLALLILLFGAFGAMMIFSSRSKKKMAAKAQEMQESIVAGTRVMTTSGLHATVTAVADDTIELEIAPGVYTTWVRAAVREVVVPALDTDDQAYDGQGYDDDGFDDQPYDEAEVADADYDKLSGQDVEPIHDDHPSLKKRNTDVN